LPWSNPRIYGCALERQIKEIATLAQHMKWAENANDGQAVLEETVQSLEKNMVVRYQE
jgi:hypothetical protein